MNCWLLRSSKSSRKNTVIPNCKIQLINQFIFHFSLPYGIIIYHYRIL
nr:MAG TPA: hypothetical protein [Caudoviricetes sp.]